MQTKFLENGQSEQHGPIRISQFGVTFIFYSLQHHKNISMTLQHKYHLAKCVKNLLLRFWRLADNRPNVDITSSQNQGEEHGTIETSFQSQTKLTIFPNSPFYNRCLYFCYVNILVLLLVVMDVNNYASKSTKVKQKIR